MLPKAAPRTASKSEKRRPFIFEGHSVRGGTSLAFEVPVARLPTGTMVNMPVVVLHGSVKGPTIWISAAVHGDELNGVAIVRRLVRQVKPRHLTGTIVAVPVINVFGATMGSRYLPDRRDLNRSFPGSPRGSLAARLAHLFFSRIAKRCQFGIDFHTGSNGRANLPQIRCDLDDPQTRRMAEAFAAPIMIHANLRDGSMRAAARAEGIGVMIFEAGEAMRFDAYAVEVGVAGTLRVLAAMGMVDHAPPAPEQVSRVSRKTSWVRAGRSGFFLGEVALGQRVEPGHRVGTIFDSIGKQSLDLHAANPGTVIGLLRTAVVHRGDALAHVAEVEA